MWQTWQHVSKPCQLVFALDLSFHLVMVGFTILCSQCWMLTNLKASSVAFIEIWGNCLFYMFRDTTFNLCGFGMLMWEQHYYISLAIFWFHLLITSTSSRDRQLSLYSLKYWNQWKSILMAKSKRVGSNWGVAMYCK